MVETVRATAAMIAGMSPRATPGDWVFVAADGADGARLRAVAIGWFVEDEGASAIVPVAEAAALGHPHDLPMRRIALDVHSALDGVGLTAAVAQSLAAAGIACNMVAALRHDHVFVPAERADEALALLRTLAGAAPTGYDGDESRREP